MHLSSLIRMSEFFKEYLKPGDTILDVGSQAVQKDGRCYRHVLDLVNIKAEYIGLDIEPGDNVNIVVSDPYNWDELNNDTFDIVISGQTLEHVEFFWQTFKEMARVLKPGGFMCVIAPKLIKQHRFPVDCWRFYPDSMRALAKWASITCLSAEAEHCNYVAFPNRPIDCVGVFQK